MQKGENVMTILFVIDILAEFKNHNLTTLPYPKLQNDQPLVWRVLPIRNIDIKVAVSLPGMQFFTRLYLLSRFYWNLFWLEFIH